MEENFDFSLIQNQLNAFLSTKIIPSITMNIVKVHIFLKRQAFMDIFLSISFLKSGFGIKKGNRNHFISSGLLFRFAF